MATRYRANPAFERQMDADPATRRGLGDVADSVAKRATADAPHGFMGLRRTIRAGRDGADAAVFAGPGWHLVEFGTATTGPRALIRRTLSSLGLTLKARRG